MSGCYYYYCCRGKFYPISQPTACRFGPSRSADPSPLRWTMKRLLALGRYLWLLWLLWLLDLLNFYSALAGPVTCDLLSLPPPKALPAPTCPALLSLETTAHSCLPALSALRYSSHFACLTQSTQLTCLPSSSSRSTDRPLYYPQAAPSLLIPNNLLIARQ